MYFYFYINIILISTCISEYFIILIGIKIYHIIKEPMLGGSFIVGVNIYLYFNQGELPVI